MLISIVDDDPWAREGVRDLIESLGYSASMFASAEEFLESGFITETTCLITDLQMQLERSRPAATVAGSRPSRSDYLHHGISG